MRSEWDERVWLCTLRTLKRVVALLLNISKLLERAFGQTRRSDLNRPLVTRSSLSLHIFVTFLHVTKVDSKIGSPKLNVIIVLVLRQKRSGNYYS
jgi:hypothetical protein